MTIIFISSTTRPLVVGKIHCHCAFPWNTLCQLETLGDEREAVQPFAPPGGLSCPKGLPKKRPSLKMKAFFTANPWTPLNPPNPNLLACLQLSWPLRGPIRLRGLWSRRFTFGARSRDLEGVRMCFLGHYNIKRCCYILAHSLPGHL